MPPRKKAPLPAGDEPALDGTHPIPQSTPESAPAPCPVCFPDGWRDEVTACGCEHGSWLRTVT